MEKIKITKEDYEECLKFILKLKYLWGGATIDFASSGVKRDIGKYIHDHIGGKLAEIAVKKFLKQKYNLNIELGFEKYTSAEDFMLGDIEKVTKSDGTKVSPKLKVEIKATKLSSRWWLISDNEFDSREYDVYILVVIDLPLDHILRFFKDSLKLDDKELEKAIPDFGTIDAEIKGIVWRDEFKNNTLKFNAGDSVFETEIFDVRPRIMGTATETQLRNNEFTLKKIPQSFKINGQYKFYVKTSPRGAETKYIKTISDVVISHKILGEYTLGKGKIFLITDKYLSPLRIANRGYPLRSVPNKEATWKDFLKKLA
ncbi:hypothetical protein HZB00_00280 [Candidatus Woesearchaeota archaeon]|nr:hypothetical protein [Candidatus Woesearchaeota archaeon]